MVTAAVAVSLNEYYCDNEYSMASAPGRSESWANRRIAPRQTTIQLRGLSSVRILPASTHVVHLFSSFVGSLAECRHRVMHWAIRRERSALTERSTRITCSPLSWTDGTFKYSTVAMLNEPEQLIIATGEHES